MTKNKLYNLKERSKANAILFQQPSLAKQEFKAECDIRQIMAKFEKTGVLEHEAKTQGRYGDFTSAPKYHEAMTIVAEADEMFKSIPSHIRAMFSNDPAEFLEFAQDPENIDDLVELGLAKPHKAPSGSSNDDPVATTTPKTSTASPDASTTKKEGIDL